LLNELAALTCPAILVLDDYHMVESQECHRSLSFLVEHLPPTLQLVLSTRSDPPLPLARLRARDELRELHAADLRFTEEEAAAFLNDRAEVQLSPGDLATLHQRTEGWPAGLQLAALTLKGAPDPGVRVATFTGSHRHVIDYLGTELLHAQPPATQAFLRHTSVLQRLSAPTRGASASMHTLQRPRGSCHTRRSFSGCRHRSATPSPRTRTRPRSSASSI